MNEILLKNGYLFIPGFINKEKAAGLARNFKKYCELETPGGDTQALNSESSYNYLEFLELLCNKVEHVSQLAGTQVLPTYTYARIYKKDSILEAHKDRDACEVSLTLNLSKDKEWDFFIQKLNGETSKITMSPGDAVMYLGCDVIHWREKFDGNEYTQVFLHYVKSRDKRNYAYFDNKEKEHRPFFLYSDTQLAVNRKTSLDRFVVEIENVLDDNIINRLYKEYIDLENNTWYDTSVSSESIIDKKVRNCQAIGISSFNELTKNLSEKQELDFEVYKACSKAFNEYKFKFPHVGYGSEKYSDSGYEILKYEVGNFYRQHTDSFNTMPRKLSCSIALNDDYEGGEFGFFDNTIKIKAKKGSAILFPSNFMFPHEINPVTKGTRYSIITWLF